MDKSFIINEQIIFHSSQNLLVNLVDSEKTATLNEPCSRCLTALLEGQGEIVSQSQLYEAGWGDAYAETSPNTLYQNILLARKALKSVSESHDDFIITIPRKGFRFNESLSVRVVDKQNELPLLQNEASATEGESCGEQKSIPILSLNRWAIPITILMLVAAITISVKSIVDYKIGDQTDFTHEFNFITQRNGCKIYINANTAISNTETSSLLSKWPEITAGCLSLPVRYLTIYRDTMRVFFLSCNTPDKVNRTCKTGYLRKLK